MYVRVSMCRSECTRGGGIKGKGIKDKGKKDNEEGKKELLWQPPHSQLHGWKIPLQTPVDSGKLALTP